MKKIVGIIRPFDMYQTFYVYQNGNKLDYLKIRVSDIPDTVLALSSQYQTYQVDLSGSKHYIEGIAKQIKQKEAEKYSENNLIINCI